jgi:DNA-binding CsgD family transcriptional regulator
MVLLKKDSPSRAGNPRSLKKISELSLIPPETLVWLQTKKKLFSFPKGLMTMIRQDVERIYNDELTLRQKQVLRLFLEGNQDADIVEQIGGKDRTLATQHIRNVCRKFNIIPENDTDYRYTLVELFWKAKSEILTVSKACLEKHGIIDNAQSYPYPDRPLKTDSPLYIERPKVESVCLNKWNQDNPLLRIKSSPKKGKTSLIKRIIKGVTTPKNTVIYLNLEVIEEEKFVNIRQFLLSVLGHISDNLPHHYQPLPWDDRKSSTLSLTEDLKKILTTVDGNLILVFDAVDKLFDYSAIYTDFFYMLRHWFQQVNESEDWGKLRLVIAYNTDDYGRLDLHRSPFNVGTIVELQEFTLDQAQTLANRYGVKREAVDSFYSLVGGHPYLLQMAFYHLATTDTTTDQLLQQIEFNGGIYEDFLLDLLETLNTRTELKDLFQLLLNEPTTIAPKKQFIKINQLQAMGLIKYENNTVNITCQLYQDYFCDRL